MTIEEAVDHQIEELVGQLGAANALESARIRTRITELEALKKEHVTT